MDLWLRPSFKNLAKTNNHADCKFIIEDENGPITYACHKLVFGCASEVFQRMLYGNYEESNSGEVILRDVEKNIFERFRDYIYGYEIEKLKELNVDTLIKLTEFGNKYLVNSITEDCVKTLIWRLYSLDIIDLFKVFECANKISNKEFLEKVSSVIRSQWKNSLGNSAVYAFSTDAFKQYMNMMNGYLPEPERFTIIEMYLKLHGLLEDKKTTVQELSDTESLSDNCSASSHLKTAGESKINVAAKSVEELHTDLREEYVYELVNLIDFKKFGIKDFYEGPGKSRLLSIEQKYEFLYTIASQRSMEIEMDKLLLRESRRYQCSYCRNLFQFDSNSRSHLSDNFMDLH